MLQSQIIHKNCDLLMMIEQEVLLPSNKISLKGIHFHFDMKATLSFQSLQQIKYIIYMS